MDEPGEKQILKECQRQVEFDLFQDESLVKHPYTLSLDLYSSTLVSLSALGTIKTSGKPLIYQIDKTILTKITNDIKIILSSYQQPGSFLDIITNFNQPDNTLQAKL